MGKRMFNVVVTGGRGQNRPKPVAMRARRHLRYLGERYEVGAVFNASSEMEARRLEAQGFAERAAPADPKPAPAPASPKKKPAKKKAKRARKAAVEEKPDGEAPQPDPEDEANEPDEAA